jgi:hypothetical protein
LGPAVGTLIHVNVREFSISIFTHGGRRKKEQTMRAILLACAAALLFTALAQAQTGTPNGGYVRTPGALWCRHLLLRRDLRTWLIHLATPTSVLHPATQTSTRRRYDNSITCTATPSRLADKIEKTSTPRLFLPPWSVEELDACFPPSRRVPICLN